MGHNAAAGKAQTVLMDRELAANISAVCKLKMYVQCMFTSWRGNWKQDRLCKVNVLVLCCVVLCCVVLCCVVLRCVVLCCVVLCCVVLCCVVLCCVVLCRVVFNLCRVVALCCCCVVVCCVTTSLLLHASHQHEANKLEDE
jgi:hypothetical protein